MYEMSSRLFRAGELAWTPALPHEKCFPRRAALLPRAPDFARHSPVYGSVEEKREWRRQGAKSGRLPNPGPFRAKDTAGRYVLYSTEEK